MEKPNYKRSFLLGAFIIAGLAMLVSGVFMVGSQDKLFKKKFTLKIIFNDVNGLQQGNNVWLSGVKIGTVKKIAFYTNTQVEATISVEKLAESLICRDAMAKISTDGFIGNKIIIIYGGTKGAGTVTNGDFLKSNKGGTSTEDMLAMLQQNNKNLLTVTDNLKIVTGKIAKGEGTIGGLVNDASLLKNMQATISNLRNASRKSELVINNIDAFSERLNTPNGLVNELFTDTTMFLEMSAAVADLKSAMARLKSTTLATSSFIDNLQSATQQLNKNDNTAGMLLQDEELAGNLKEIIKNLKSGSYKLDEDLEALQHNFLLRGYFRKKQKNK